MVRDLNLYKTNINIIPYMILQAILKDKHLTDSVQRYES